MKIMIDSIFYDKQSIGIAKYSGELAQYMSEMGHSVTVITTHSHYPKWKIETRNGFLQNRHGNLKEFISPILLPKNEKMNASSRAKYEISYFISTQVSYLLSLFRPQDVIIAVYPSLFSVISGYVHSKIKGSLFIVHIQDLQVDAASELGIIKKGKSIKILKYVESQLIKRADYISSISDNMIKRCQEISENKVKIISFPNWADEISEISSIESAIYRETIGVKQDKFVVLYSGNLGEKQGLEDIIKAASILRNNESIHFVISGSGGAKSRLMELSHSLELNNITYIDLQPKEKLSELLSAADMHIISQKRGAADLVLPSKLANCLASSKVTLVTADENTSLFKIISNNRIGIIAEPESPESIAQCILHVHNNKEDMADLGIRARKYALDFLSKNSILARFELDLASAIENRLKRRKR